MPKTKTTLLGWLVTLPGTGGAVRRRFRIRRVASPLHAGDRRAELRAGGLWVNCFSFRVEPDGQVSLDTRERRPPKNRAHREFSLDGPLTHMRTKAKEGQR